MRIEAWLNQLADETTATCLGEYGIHAEAPKALVKRTQEINRGDYQLNGLLALAKKYGQNPKNLAEKVAKKLASHPAFELVTVGGPGFVNLTFHSHYMAHLIEQNVGDLNLGIEPVLKPQTIVVDFSGPNIAKQMHVGHLRSTIIGASIVRMLRRIGHKMISDNHIGDWGTQFGLLIAGIRRWGLYESAANIGIAELERLYKLASTTAKDDEAFAAMARNELAKLQGGDEENRKLWQAFSSTTKKSLSEVYAMLGVEFDVWLGESSYNEMLPGVVHDLKTAGIAKHSDGALCVFFADLPDSPVELQAVKDPCIIQKKDGSYLYATTDIATCKYRDQHFKSDRNINVVDCRQTLHFKQIFAIASMLGYRAKNEHVGFGSVLGPDQKPLKTRDGENTTLRSLLDEAVARAKARIEEEKFHISEMDLDSVAHKVGIGAIKYADLRQNRMSDYVFDWDKMISFKGNSGPYLQYAYARIRAIFRKYGVSNETSLKEVARHFSVKISHPSERSLARELLCFPDVLHHAADSGQPHLLCDHLYHLVREFSHFYEACPILQAELEVKQSRLSLAAFTADQLELGLHCLGIDTVNLM